MGRALDPVFVDVVVMAPRPSGHNEGTMEFGVRPAGPFSKSETSCVKLRNIGGLLRLRSVPAPDSGLDVQIRGECISHDCHTLIECATMSRVSGLKRRSGW